MDLLTPAESRAFQSFLSAMDHVDLSPSEWALLNNTNAADDDDGHSSELLAKATKDLMALDASCWDSLIQQQHGLYSHQSEQHQTYPNAYSHRQTPYSRRETFPFLANNKAQMQQSMLSIPPHSTDLHTHLGSPTATSAPTSATTTPATPQSPFGFPDLPSSHPHLAQVQLNQPHLHQQRASSPGTKRSSSNAASGSSKRPRPSPPAASAPSQPIASGSTKQVLLSPSQKKANHIQSEQKRRANIRRGYEALCETVPALREAIREEEEAEARATIGLSSGKPSRSKRKKKDTVGGDGEKEKIDGRAGPRSENIVLSRTIEYINELLSDRSSLLTRLERARSSLPSGHPALVPTCTGETLWEREWKGGEGRLDGEGGEDEDENNDDGDST